MQFNKGIRRYKGESVNDKTICLLSYCFNVFRNQMRRDTMTWSLTVPQETQEKLTSNHRGIYYDIGRGGGGVRLGFFFKLKGRKE